LKGVAVTQKSPTKTGDALVLRTQRSYTIFAVGAVSNGGQEDFHRQKKVRHVTTRIAAIALARTLVTAGGRIHMLDIDSGEWSQLALIH
jgi:hypothetical protein